mgnify:CR=1 FL=1
MATYEEIYGKRVDVFDSDPTLNSSYEGQVWYDSATGNLKSVVTFSAWVSSTGPTAQLVSLASGGTQTACILAGENGANPSDSAKAEEYNGSGWSTLPNMPAA